MHRLLTSAIFAAFAVGIFHNQASAEMVVPRPPAVLSPDLTGPWLMQISPGNRPAFANPAPQSAAFTPAMAPPPVPPGARYYGRPIDPAFLPAVVAYPTGETKGTIVIDTDARYLYLLLGDGKARRYGVGVGRPGFEWAGAHRISRKAEWPDWVPPDEMRQRVPNLPVHMTGGPDNPLGARALYLGSTLYRIHGSNEPWTIGHAVSSGCIRMRNEDITDLYGRVEVGTRVIVI